MSSNQPLRMRKLTNDKTVWAGVSPHVIISPGLVCLELTIRVEQDGPTEYQVKPPDLYNSKLFESLNVWRSREWREWNLSKIRSEFSSQVLAAPV